MNEIIRNYYSKNNVPEYLISQKIECFEKHPDIAKEFEYWISTGEYVKESAIEIEGYTAEKVARSSKYLNGEGAFRVLIDLREKKEKTMKQLERGYKMK